MSGSLEVRQFLLKYEGADSAPSYVGGVPAQRTGHPDAQRVSDDQVRRARLTVAMGATDAQDCARLLDMLGLTRDDEGQAPVQR